MTEFTIAVTREELGILIDALETWPGSRPSETATVEGMVSAFQTMYDQGMP